MSYADLPPGACYAPELHLETFWLVKYGDHALLMCDDDFVEFMDQVKYEGIEYEAEPVRRTREWFNSLGEARI